MTEHRSISMLTCLGLAAIVPACSRPSMSQSVQHVDLPPGTNGHLDTLTARSLPYTLREDNGTATVDTGFMAQFGGGNVILPLDAFYGSTVAGQVGQWAVDGRGRVAKIAGSSTPGFLNRLESMPDGPIAIGQTWEYTTPSDDEAMASSEAVMQTKRVWRVDDSFSTPTGSAVRVHVDGWSRFVENAALTQFLSDAEIDNPQPNLTPNLNATIDVELASGTLLGMKLYEDFLGDAATPDELAGTAGSSTYCIDLTSGYTASSDICGWDQ